MKNKISLLLTLCSIILLYSFCNIHKQGKNTIKTENNLSQHEVSGGPVPFTKDSFNLNEEAVLKLKKEIIYVNSIVNEQCYILLYPWSAVNETKKNPNIGILRSKAIIDFYEKNYSIKRKHFLIMDVTHFDDADWVLHPDRDDGFVNLSARFCNPKRTE